MPLKRKPIFGVAAWILPSVLTLVTMLAVHEAKIEGMAKSQWFPGLFEAVVGGSLVILSAFSCGITAILLNERYRWLGVPPVLASLGAVVWIVVKM